MRKRWGGQPTIKAEQVPLEVWGKNGVGDLGSSSAIMALEEAKQVSQVVRPDLQEHREALRSQGTVDVDTSRREPLPPPTAEAHLPAAHAPTVAGMRAMKPLPAREERQITAAAVRDRADRAARVESRNPRARQSREVEAPALPDHEMSGLSKSDVRRAQRDVRREARALQEREGTARDPEGRKRRAMPGTTLTAEEVEAQDMLAASFAADARKPSTKNSQEARARLGTPLGIEEIEREEATGDLHGRRVHVADAMLRRAGAASTRHALGGTEAGDGADGWNDAGARALEAQREDAAGAARAAKQAVRAAGRHWQAPARGDGDARALLPSSAAPDEASVEHVRGLLADAEEGAMAASRAMRRRDHGGLGQGLGAAARANAAARSAGHAEAPADAAEQDQADRDALALDEERRLVLEVQARVGPSRRGGTTKAMREAHHKAVADSRAGRDAAGADDEADLLLQVAEDRDLQTVSARAQQALERTARQQTAALQAGRMHEHAKGGQGDDDDDAAGALLRAGEEQEARPSWSAERGARALSRLRRREAAQEQRRARRAVDGGAVEPPPPTLPAAASGLTGWDDLFRPSRTPLARRSGAVRAAGGAARMHRARRDAGAVAADDGAGEDAEMIGAGTGETDVFLFGGNCRAGASTAAGSASTAGPGSSSVAGAGAALSTAAGPGSSVTDAPAVTRAPPGAPMRGPMRGPSSASGVAMHSRDVRRRVAALALRSADRAAGGDAAGEDLIERHASPEWEAPPRHAGQLPRGSRAVSARDRARLPRGEAAGESEEPSAEAWNQQQQQTAPVEAASRLVVRAATKVIRRRREPQLFHGGEGGGPEAVEDEDVRAAREAHGGDAKVVQRRRRDPLLSQQGQLQAQRSAREAAETQPVPPSEQAPEGVAPGEQDPASARRQALAASASKRGGTTLLRRVTDGVMQDHAAPSAEGLAEEHAAGRMSRQAADAQRRAPRRTRSAREEQVERGTGEEVTDPSLTAGHMRDVGRPEPPTSRQQARAATPQRRRAAGARRRRARHDEVQD